MTELTRGDVLRKCIVMFEALKRMASRGNAGILAAEGAEEEFRMDVECLEILRQMLREMETGVPVYQMGEEDRKREELIRAIKYGPARKMEDGEVRDWQAEVMRNGPPKALVL